MKRANSILIITVFFNCILLGNLWADIGETGSSFLNLGVGADALAMAGAITSASTGVNALYWNPAGLGWLRGSEITFSHAEHFQSIRHENIGYALGGKALGIGISLKGLYLSGLEERTGPSQDPIQNFGAYFIAPGITIAKDLGGKIGLGFTGKMLYQGISQDNAMSFAFDAGICTKTVKKGVMLGLALANIGPTVTFNNTASNLPTKIRGGISYAGFNDHLLIGIDLVKPLAGNIEWCAGSRIGFSDRFDLRIGYKSGLEDNGTLAGLTGGFGFKISSFNIDYALSTYGVLGITHNISLSYVFSRYHRVDQNRELLIAEELRKRAKATAESFFQLGVSQQKAGKYDDALWNYDIALIWDPQHSGSLKNSVAIKKYLIDSEVQNYLKSGVNDFNQSNYIGAIAFFSYAIEIDPANVLAQQWITAASNALVKVQIEKSQLDEATRKKISDLFEQGLASFSKKDYSTAVKEWNKVLEYDPAHKEARENITKAQQLFREQIDNALKNVDDYITKGKWLQANSEVTKILGWEPGNKSAMNKRSIIIAKMKSLSMEHSNQGLEFYKLGKYSPAEVEFKLALEFDKTNNTAIDYLNKIKSRKTVEIVSGEEINDLYMKGVTAYTQERFQEAIQYWKKVLEKDPKHPNAKRNIERAEEKLKISGK